MTAIPLPEAGAELVDIYQDGPHLCSCGAVFRTKGSYRSHLFSGMHEDLMHRKGEYA